MSTSAVVTFGDCRPNRTTRNPLRIDVYQAVYGLPASLLTHIDRYGRVYEELYSKAEAGQACPLHIHRSWNTRETRQAS